METLIGFVFVIAFGCFAVWVFTKTNRKTHKTTKQDDYIDNVQDTDNEEKDNWERFNFYGAQVIPAKGRYHITYTDQRGLTTERDITIKRAYADNNQFAVGAHCYLRNAHRSFINESISNAVDLDTGEIVASVAHHAIEQYNNSNEGKVWKAINNEYKPLLLLIYVCRADGRMLKAERAIVGDYLKRHCLEIELDDVEVDNAIKQLSEPDNREFKKIIADLKAAGEIEKLRDITDSAKRIVATQKSVDPLEKAAIEILEVASR
ncbi:MAG: TerB family tellurite resistance protein [Burkholderiales bacterium]|nr:TerB family tellurite resistance protein [Burkholderiales bacterium]